MFSKATALVHGPIDRILAIQKIRPDPAMDRERADASYDGVKSQIAKTLPEFL